VTKLQGDDRTRTRFNIDSGTMTARTRGSVSGVIAQTIEVPQQFFLSSLAVAAQGLMQPAASDRYQISSYFTPQDFDKVSGTLATMNCEARGEETVRVPTGEFRARHVTRKTEKEVSEWWLHSTLGIPVRGSVGEEEYVLTRLEMAAGK
jgi:hypothetical protein